MQPPADTPGWQIPKPFAALLLAAAALAVLAVAVWTIPDYGVGWDDDQFFIGDKNYAFLTSFDRRHLDYTQDTVAVYQDPAHPDYYLVSGVQQQFPQHVWPVGVTVSAACKDVLFTRLRWLGAVDAQHVAAALFGVGTLLVLCLFLNRHAGPWAAAAGGTALVLHPRFWGDLHYNVKDMSSCLLFLLVAMLFHAALRRRSWRLLLGVAVLWGVALATKANALFLPVVGGLCFAYEAWCRRRAGQPATTAREVAALAVFPVLGPAVMLLCWPYLWLDFPAHLVGYVKYVAGWGVTGSPGWQSRPLVLAVGTMPLPILLLLVWGLAAVVAAAWRRRVLPSWQLLLLILLVLPVLRVSLPRAVDFDGIRHWLEFVPAAAGLAGLGAADLLGRGWRAWQRRWPTAPRAVPAAVLLLLSGAWFAPTVAWLVRNHPYEVVFFNRLVGGLGGAQALQLPDATDYWCLSYRQGAQWLNAHAEPDATLFVGVGEHTLLAARRQWLRPDLRFPLLLVKAEDPQLRPEVPDLIRHAPGPVYLMYVTLRSRYGPFVTRCDAELTPVHEVRVDGGVVLKILRLPRPSP